MKSVKIFISITLMSRQCFAAAGDAVVVVGKKCTAHTTDGGSGAGALVVVFSLYSQLYQL